jgi:hypothetical protein
MHDFPSSDTCPRCTRCGADPVREQELVRRERIAPQQHEKTFALRVQEICDAQIAKATKEYRALQLKDGGESTPNAAWYPHEERKL